jgi:hypothetical protein
LLAMEHLLSKKQVLKSNTYSVFLGVIFWQK